MQLSLSRALVSLGEVIEPVMERVAAHPDPEITAHARATEVPLRDPETGFDAAIDQARREVALGSERIAASTAPHAVEALAALSRDAEPAVLVITALITAHSPWGHGDEDG